HRHQSVTWLDTCAVGLIEVANVTDHRVGAMTSPLSKRTVRRLWCIRLFAAIIDVCARNLTMVVLRHRSAV
ncbi:MAG: hypothetical protein ACOVQM_09235, partial [Pirellula sp.]